MSTKMSVTMKLDQRLAMSQQLRQAITMLQYNTLDLKQLVQHYIETNPLIDVEEHEAEPTLDDTKNYVETADVLQGEMSSNFFSADFSRRGSIYQDDENSLENYAVKKSLRDHLLEQTLLCQFTQDEQQVAEHIIDAINDDGYLTMSLEDIHSMISVNLSIQALTLVLNKIQTFDPVGVGARNIQECLSIQLKNLQEKDENWDLAFKIIDQYFDKLSSGHAKQIVKDLKLTTQQYSDAIHLIRTLNAHPGNQFSNEINVNVEPELYVKKVKNKWKVFLTESILTNLKINKNYQELIRQNKKHGSYPALKQELEEARNLLKGLSKRNETLYSVAKHIIAFQQDFLDQGPAFMRSMNIVDVSQALNIHESTVSRVTSGKYIITPRGVFELKYFFPSHVNMQSGSQCSAIAVKTYIKEIIESESSEHAYSDEEISEMLNKKGINIARRTITKYRESMNILSSYQRMRDQVVS